MQLGAAQCIDVVFSEDAKAREAATKWYQLQGLAPTDRRLARLSSFLSTLCIYFGAIGFGGLLGALVGASPALATWPTVFIGALIAWIGAHRWMVWSMGLAKKIHDAHDTGGWGTIRCRFDADGFTVRDALRDWRSDWRGVALVEAKDEGLFIAGKGNVWYFPVANWGDPERMRAAAVTIIGWWRTATRSAR